MQKPRFTSIHCDQGALKISCPYIFDDNGSFGCCAYQGEQKKDYIKLDFVGGSCSPVVRCKQCIEEFGE